MYKIIIGQNERCCAFVRARIPFCRRKNDTCIGLELNGRLVAVVLYCNPTLFDIEMHVVLEGRITRAFIVAAFSYPFLQLGKRRISTHVPRSNAAAEKLIKHFGFTFEGIKYDGYDEEDLIMYGMRRAQCRFIQKAAPLVRAMIEPNKGVLQ